MGYAVDERLLEMSESGAEGTRREDRQRMTVDKCGECPVRNVLDENAIRM